MRPTQHDSTHIKPCKICPSAHLSSGREGSELALCSLFIATLFPGWVCLPNLQFWLRHNGGHISRSGFGANLCFMTCHNFMTYSVMFLINSVKGDFDFKYITLIFKTKSLR